MARTLGTAGGSAKPNPTDDDGGFAAGGLDVCKPTAIIPRNAGPQAITPTPSRDDMTCGVMSRTRCAW
jgi:hypothetical protein